MTNTPWIGESLDAFLSADAPADLARALSALAQAALPLAHAIRRGRMAAIAETAADAALESVVEQAVDVFADTAFVDGLSGSDVRGVVSSQREEPVALDSDGTLLVAIDPPGGSSNIEANIAIGAIFSVLDAPAGELRTAHFLQSGTRQRAAGFVIYGPHVGFVFTTGGGVHTATLDPDANAFRISRLRARIPAQAGEFVINASNSRHWPGPVRAYVEDCLESDEGADGRNTSMGWVGSLVADAYRILAHGGVYLYPEDSREGHANGRVRLFSQANPIALLIEQAGGAAIDGFERILEIAPRSIHARTPLIFGSSDKVERVQRYYSEDASLTSSSPLFGKRGLLRR